MHTVSLVCYMSQAAAHVIIDRGGSRLRAAAERARNRHHATCAKTKAATVCVLEAELKLALAEIERRSAEAQAPETLAGRVAELLLEDLEDLPSPLGLAEILAGQAPERARAVADEASRPSPGSVTALTFAAEVARTVEEDPERAADLLNRRSRPRWIPTARSRWRGT